MTFVPLLSQYALLFQNLKGCGRGEIHLWYYAQHLH